MFDLTQPPTFKWRPWPCARLRGRVASTFTTQASRCHCRSHKGSRWLLRNFIPRSSHHIRCLRVWKVSTLVLQDLACACLYGRMHVAMPNYSQTILFMDAGMDNVFQLRMPCIALQGKSSDMCDFPSEENYISLSWYQKCDFRKEIWLCQPLQILWIAHNTSMSTQKNVKRNHLSEIKSQFSFTCMLIFGVGGFLKWRYPQILQN